MNNSFSYLIECINSHRTLIFDLDDTIYLETDFLFKQYHLVSKVFTPDCVSIGYEFFKSTFASEGRLMIFEKFILHFKLDANVTDIMKVFRDYSEHKQLSTYKWFFSFSELMRDKIHLIIVTNGNVSQQKEKVKRLHLELYFDHIEVFYANEFEPKPSEAVSSHINKLIKLYKPVYIGDSEVDREFSINSGFEFFDVKTLHQL